MIVIDEDIRTVLSAPLPWRSFAGKTVVVTGAAGFLPAYLVETLLAMRGIVGVGPDRVIGLVRTLSKAEARFNRHLGRSDLTLIHGDVSQKLAWDGPVDMIIHAASQASPKYYGVDPVGTIKANVLGCSHLLDLARAKSSTHFLYFSSSEIYGQMALGQQAIRETDMGFVDCTHPRACYAEAKRLGEALCVAYHQQYGINATIVRPFHTYGPGMALDDGRVFADFVADILARRDISLKSDGLAKRAFCYAADATIGFLAVLLKGVPATAYNVGNPDGEISIRGLAELLAETFKDRGIGARLQPRPQDDVYMASQIARNCPDITRLQALGWIPTTGIATGFRRTVDSFET